MKLVIKESNETNSDMTIKEFMKDVKAIYSKHFPDSWCKAQFVKNLGGAIFIDFYLAKDESEVPHGYAVNDMFSCGFVIHLDNKKTSDDNLPQTITLQAMSSVIKTKPSNRFLAFDATKVPFRKSTGDTKKILTAIDKYLVKLANAIKIAYENDAIADEYKKVVDSKIRDIK